MCVCNVCMYVCTYVCMHVMYLCMYVVCVVYVCNVCMYASMHACMYISIVRTYARMRACVFAPFGYRCGDVILFMGAMCCMLRCNPNG